MIKGKQADLKEEMLGAVIEDASFGKVKRHLDLKVELIGAVSNLFCDFVGHISSNLTS